MEDTISFARGLNLDEAVFNIASPMPGTLLYETAKSLGYHISDKWEDFNYYSQKRIIIPDWEAGRLKYLQLKALFVFYLSSRRLKYVFRHFCSLRGLRKLLCKIKGSFNNEIDIAPNPHWNRFPMRVWSRGIFLGG